MNAFETRTGVITNDLNRQSDLGVTLDAPTRQAWPGTQPGKPAKSIEKIPHDASYVDRRENESYQEWASRLIKDVLARTASQVATDQVQAEFHAIANVALEALDRYDPFLAVPVLQRIVDEQYLIAELARDRKIAKLTREFARAHKKALEALLKVEKTMQTDPAHRLNRGQESIRALVAWARAEVSTMPNVAHKKFIQQMLARFDKNPNDYRELAEWARDVRGRQAQIAVITNKNVKQDAGPSNYLIGKFERDCLTRILDNLPQDVSSAAK